MEKKWKQFERLVAAIHQSLGGADAKITWDEDLAGRQFDLTIRFSHFAYDYLTTVEVKDYLVPVKEVEAFVTKGRRAGANKLVLVSSTGFQSGAIEVAKDEKVDLFVLKEAEDWPEYLKVVKESPVLGITQIELASRDGTVLHRFPWQASALQYYVTHSIIKSKGQARTLDELIMGARPEWEPQVTSEKTLITLPLPPRARLEIPYFDPVPAAMVRFTAEIAKGLEIDSGGLDLSMVPALFSFKNVITGDEQKISEFEIWLGIDTEIRAGAFYHDPLHSINYYCEQRVGNKLSYVIVESYQHGELFQARVKQTLTGGIRVVEITDEREQKRLRRMYEQYVARVDAQPVAAALKVGRNDPCPCGSGFKYKKCHGAA